MGERPRIIVDGVDFEWDRDSGLMLIWGQPVLCIWIETTMAGLMSGIHKMVGTERFRIACEQAGRDSVEGEWEHIILPQPTLEEGFAVIGKSTSTVGLGSWELVEIDRDQQELRFRSRNDWESLYQRALGVDWGPGTLLGKLGGYGTKVFETYCRAQQTASVARGDAYDEFVVRPSPVTEQDDLDTLVAHEKATRADLNAALERLREEVAERKRVEDELRREIEERARVEHDLRGKLDLIRQQEEAIRAMSTPILRLWDGILTMPVIGFVDNDRGAQMMERLLDEITRTHARYAILDVTGVDMIDTAAASHILGLVNATRLLGARCLISGISPSMANTVVHLGLDFAKLDTFATLEAALRYALQERQRTTTSRGR